MWLSYINVVSFELGVSTLIHRKVIVSMIQKILIGDYDIGMCIKRAEDMLCPTELAPSFPLVAQSYVSKQSKQQHIQEQTPFDTSGYNEMV